VTTTDLFAPRARIRVGGVHLSADVSNRVLSVRYDNNLDLADMGTIVLDNSAGRFTDSPLFELGKQLEIYMGYGDDLHPMMLGEIASISPSFPSGGAPTLSVTGYDRSQRLRHDAVTRPAWKRMNDSAIAARIAVESGLVPVVDPSPYFHESLPHEGTDMAFLKSRAKANFFEVFVRWDRLYFRYPRPQTEAHVLEWGRSLSSFTPRLSSGGQAGVQVVRGYNEELAQTIVGVAAATDLDLDAVVERLGGAALDTLVGLGRRVVRNQPVKSSLDAATLARSLLQEILEGLYEGSGDCVGVPALRAGEQVVIRGVGKRFSGRYRLKRVTHTIDAGGYRTSFEVTQRSGASMLQLLRKATVDTPPPDRPETYQGVVLAKVEAVKPATYTVEVSFPWYADSTERFEADCMALAAGDGRGVEFLPEAGDHVLVAFEHGNFATPFVLGTIWPQTAAKPAGAEGVRRIRTAGHTITLDGTKDAEKVVVQDKGGSTVTLDHDGTVTVTAKKHLVLNARDGEIQLNAKDVRVKVTGSMDVSKLTGA
jgi:phage protein D